MATSQKLPHKESGIFKKVVRSYECKQYKTGLKFAKQILSNPKCADHGETLAMKGLILNCLGRKDEAYDHARKGLRSDLKSHVCWHVYGLIQRSDKKYDEAIKCYRNALKHDKENIQILRDLSLLQIQMRDLDGFRDTRYQLLKTRPAQRSSWVGYALAYHLLNDYVMALKVMAEYRKTQTEPLKLPDYEFSEMVLYEVQLYMEAKRYQEALDHMEKFHNFISDDLTYTETKADVLLSKNDRAAAEILYCDLLQRNPENYSYYKNLEKCLDLSTPEDRLRLYKMLKEEHPRSHVCKRIPLNFTSGETFRQLIDEFLRPPLHKGVPSLFIGLKGLYKDPDKVKIIEEVVLGYEASLQKCEKFCESGNPEPPTAILWVWFFLSQHYNKLGNHTLALEYIDKAIDHTPTHIELYMLKSKIFQCAGDSIEAADWIDEARLMDTADRFVNCQCVKYLLRINEIDRAIETAGLFTRDGLAPLQTLDDMQCMWFQTELARAHTRLGQYGEALVLYHQMDKHFLDIVEDQFDFHTYCMRKMTLRPYVGVLKLEDNLKSHRSYFIAAVDAIKLYTLLHDNPNLQKPQVIKVEPPKTEDLSHLSESERKKYQRKQRKAQAKAQAKAEQERGKENRPHGGHDKKDKEDDFKPKFNPKELLEVEKPIEEAVKFLMPLQQLCRDRIETHLLSYTVHSRRGKFLLMLQALKRAFAIDPNNPELHEHLIDYLHLLKAKKTVFPEPVQVVIDTSLPQMTQGLTPEEINKDFIAKHKEDMGSIDHMISGTRVLYRLHPDQQDKAVSLVTVLPASPSKEALKSCTKVLELLKSGDLGDCSHVIPTYCSQCHALFPIATIFKPSEEAVSETDSGFASCGSARSCSGHENVRKKNLTLSSSLTSPNSIEVKT